MAFVTYRIMGYSVKESWEKLGIYGGDDGVTPDVDPKVYQAVCRSLGQVLECDVIQRGKPGVNFLSRFYSPEVWEGNTSNCCDIKRALQKIHVTSAVTLTPKEKLYEKCFALFLTDKNTPIIGAFVRKVVALHEESKGPEFENKLDNWNARFTEENEQYVNENDDYWMHDLLDKQLPGFRLTAYERWVATCRNLDMCMECPTLMDVEFPVPPRETDIKVNGELYRRNVPGVVPIIPINAKIQSQPPEQKGGSHIEQKAAGAVVQNAFKNKNKNNNKNKNYKNKNQNKNSKRQYIRKDGQGARVPNHSTSPSAPATNGTISAPPMRATEHEVFNFDNDSKY
nr:RNA-dependent RNA polymerase [Flumine noda-like virus 36]